MQLPCTVPKEEARDFHNFSAELRQHLVYTSNQFSLASSLPLHCLDEPRPDLVGASHVVTPQVEPELFDGRLTIERNERTIHVHQHVAGHIDGSAVLIPLGQQLL